MKPDKQCMIIKAMIITEPSLQQVEIIARFFQCYRYFRIFYCHFLG